MKRYVRASISESDLTALVKEFNKQRDYGRITVKGNSYKYASFERDYFGYGKLSKLLSALDAKLENYSDPSIDDKVKALWRAAYDCVEDYVAGQTAREIRELSKYTREMDLEWGIKDPSKM